MSMPVTIPFPKNTVNAVLGLGTIEEPRVLGAHTYESTRDLDSYKKPHVCVELTLPEVGLLFKWAWEDADWTMREGDDPPTLEQALSDDRDDVSPLLELMAHCAQAQGLTRDEKHVADIREKLRAVARSLELIAARV